MNLQFYLGKLENSEEFKNFKKDLPKAFLCSAFFSIDKVGKDNKTHFDFFANGKIFSFQLENNCKKTLLENYGKSSFERINENIDFEFEKIEKLIEKKVEKEGIKNKIQKLLLSLQQIKGEEIITGMIFISGLGMLKIKIDISKMKITDFEKKSFFDMINIIKK